MRKHYNIFLKSNQMVDKAVRIYFVLCLESYILLYFVLISSYQSAKWLTGGRMCVWEISVPLVLLLDTLTQEKWNPEMGAWPALSGDTCQLKTACTEPFIGWNKAESFSGRCRAFLNWGWRSRTRDCTGMNDRGYQFCHNICKILGEPQKGLPHSYFTTKSKTKTNNLHKYIF